MTEVATLIQKVEAARGRLTLDGDQLVLDAPEDFPDEVVEDLRQHKEELLVHYTSVQTFFAWASELAEQDLVLSTQLSYVEAPHRTVVTGRVSWYASHYLKTIVSAREYQQNANLCWGQWTPAWWREREADAISSLTALKDALGILKRRGLTEECLS